MLDLFFANFKVDIGPDDASGDGQEGGGGGGEVVNDVVYPAEESGSGGLYYNSLSVSNSRLAHKHATCHEFECPSLQIYSIIEKAVT